MRIKKTRVQHLQIPLKHRFSQANNSTSKSDTTLFFVKTETGKTGIGEACPRLYVTGETQTSVRHDLEQYFAEKTQEWTTLNAIKKTIVQELPSQIGAAAICCMEGALLDAFAQEKGVDLAQLLGLNWRNSYAYSGVIPYRPLEKFPNILNIISLFDFKNIKLKVNQDIADSLAKIKLIRGRFGADIPIRLDANCSWSKAEAMEQIPIYLRHGVHTFEQILHPIHDAEMPEITATFGDKAQLMADESLTDFASAKRLVKAKAFNRFNLKLSKNGGYFNTLKIQQFLQRNGYVCQLGAHFGETSVLTKMGVLLATAAPEISILEGAFGTHLLEEDIVPNSLKFNQAGEVTAMQLGATFSEKVDLLI